MRAPDDPLPAGDALRFVVALSVFLALSALAVLIARAWG